MRLCQCLSTQKVYQNVQVKIINVFTLEKISCVILCSHENFCQQYIRKIFFKISAKPKQIFSDLESILNLGAAEFTSYNNSNLVT